MVFNDVVAAPQSSLPIVPMVIGGVPGFMLAGPMGAAIGAGLGAVLGSSGGGARQAPVRSPGMRVAPTPPSNLQPAIQAGATLLSNIISWATTPTPPDATGTVQSPAETGPSFFAPSQVVEIPVAPEPAPPLPTMSFGDFDLMSPGGLFWLGLIGFVAYKALSR